MIEQYSHPQQDGYTTVDNELLNRAGGRGVVKPRTAQEEARLSFFVEQGYATKEQDGSFTLAPDSLTPFLQLASASDEHRASELVADIAEEGDHTIVVHPPDEPPKDLWGKVVYADSVALSEGVANPEFIPAQAKYVLIESSTGEYHYWQSYETASMREGDTVRFNDSGAWHHTYVSPSDVQFTRINQQGLDLNKQNMEELRQRGDHNLLSASEALLLREAGWAAISPETSESGLYTIVDGNQDVLGEYRVAIGPNSQTGRTNAVLREYTQRDMPYPEQVLRMSQISSALYHDGGESRFVSQIDAIADMRDRVNRLAEDYRQTFNPEPTDPGLDAIADIQDHIEVVHAEGLSFYSEHRGSLTAPYDGLAARPIAGDFLDPNIQASLTFANAELTRTLDELSSSGGALSGSLERLQHEVALTEALHDKAELPELNARYTKHFTDLQGALSKGYDEQSIEKHEGVYAPAQAYNYIQTGGDPSAALGARTSMAATLLLPKGRYPDFPDGRVITISPEMHVEGEVISTGELEGHGPVALIGGGGKLYLYEDMQARGMRVGETVRVTGGEVHLPQYDFRTGHLTKINPEPFHALRAEDIGLDTFTLASGAVLSVPKGHYRTGRVPESIQQESYNKERPYQLIGEQGVYYEPAGGGVYRTAQIGVGRPIGDTGAPSYQTNGDVSVAVVPKKGAIDVVSHTGERYSVQHVYHRSYNDLNVSRHEGPETIINGKAKTIQFHYGPGQPQYQIKEHVIPATEYHSEGHLLSAPIEGGVSLSGDRQTSYFAAQNISLSPVDRPASEYPTGTSLPEPTKGAWGYRSRQTDGGRVTIDPSEKTVRVTSDPGQPDYRVVNVYHESDAQAGVHSLRDSPRMAANEEARTIELHYGPGQERLSVIADRSAQNTPEGLVHRDPREFEDFNQAIRGVESALKAAKSLAQKIDRGGR